MVLGGRNPPFPQTVIGGGRFWILVLYCVGKKIQPPTPLSPAGGLPGVAWSHSLTQIRATLPSAISANLPMVPLMAVPGPLGNPQIRDELALCHIVFSHLHHFHQT